MLKASYIVQNPHMTPSAARATINGEEMVATVDALEVELVSKNLTHGGIKLRFIGQDVAAAKELFANDSEIEVSFAKYGGETPAEPVPPPGG